MAGGKEFQFGEDQKGGTKASCEGCNQELNKDGKEGGFKGRQTMEKAGANSPNGRVEKEIRRRQWVKVKRPDFGYNCEPWGGGRVRALRP